MSDNVWNLGSDTTLCSQVLLNMCRSKQTSVKKKEIVITCEAHLSKHML